MGELRMYYRFVIHCCNSVRFQNMLILSTHKANLTFQKTYHQILVELGSEILRKRLQAATASFEQILSEIEIAGIDLKRREKPTERVRKNQVEMVPSKRN